MPAPTTATDAELVARAAGGERAAFSALFERHADAVHDHVARWSRDPMLAADATQEAFVSLLRNLDSLRDGQAVLAWLLRTARNRAIDQLRRTERERADFDTPIATAVLTATGQDRSTAPEAAAMTHETAELVWEVAAGLDERTFTVLDLHVRQELDGPEIAAVMDTTPDNANVLVHRMRDRMRTLFGAVLLLRTTGDCDELEALRAAAPDPVDLAAARRVRDHAEDCPTCAPHRARAVAPLRAYSAFAKVRAPVTVRSAVMAAADQHFGTGPPSTRLRRALPLALALVVLVGVVGTAFGLRSTDPAPQPGPPTAAGEVVPSPSPSPSPTPEPTPTPTLDTLGSPSAAPEPVDSPSPSPSAITDPTPPPAPPPQQLAVQIERPVAGSTFEATDEDDRGRSAAVVPVRAAVTGGLAAEPDVVWTSSLAPGEVLLGAASGDLLLWLSAGCTDTPHTVTVTATDPETDESVTSSVEVTIRETCLTVDITSPTDQGPIDATPENDGTHVATIAFSGEADDEVNWAWSTTPTLGGQFPAPEGVQRSDGQTQVTFENCPGSTTFLLVVDVERVSDGATAQDAVTIAVECRPVPDP